MEPTAPYTTTITSTLPLDMAGLPTLTVDLAQAHVDAWSLGSPLAAPLLTLALIVIVFGLAEALPQVVRRWIERSSA
jgi:hypothetical protein